MMRRRLAAEAAAQAGGRCGSNGLAMPQASNAVHRISDRCRLSKIKRCPLILLIQRIPNFLIALEF